jgi:hypothetical protein
MNQKALLLFNYDWDARGFADAGQRLGVPVDSAGFDLFSFPSSARLAWFDIDRFVARLARQAKQAGWTAVASHHEQFGALVAALLAEKLGLPGTSPTAVAACQHKLYAREVLQRVCPEANVGFARLPCAYGDNIPAGLRYPQFVKPVKAAFSVLARHVENQAQLHAHTRFGVYELWVIRRLVEPFERVARRLIPQAGTAHSMMLEEPQWTERTRPAQYSLDGIAFNGSIQPLGVVDSVMYPGTQAFMRFDYPSQLPADIQARALDVARKFLNAVGFDHGIFNMEFFYDAATDRISVIEFNPRLASQFADLYQRVDGFDLYAMSLALAHGQDPWAVPRFAPTARVASSFVYRAFSAHSARAMPNASQLAALHAQFPDHYLLQFAKAGHALERDFKWLGSYRYGILHLGGENAADLRARCQAASALLGWPAPYAAASGRVASDTQHDTATETSASEHHPIIPAIHPWSLST